MSFLRPTASTSGLASSLCSCLRQPSSRSFRNAAVHKVQTSSTTLAADEQEAQASTSTSSLAQDEASVATGQEEGMAEGRVQAGEEAIEMSDAHHTIAERRRKMVLMEELESIGSSQTRHNSFQPHHASSRAASPSSLTLSHLLSSTAQLGHATALASPYAYPYIHMNRHGLSIIDVRETLAALRRAAALVRSTVEKDGIVLFLGGSNLKESEKILSKQVRKMGRNGYAAGKWMPGTLTNSTRLYSGSQTLIQQMQAKQREQGRSVQGEDDASRLQQQQLNPTHLKPDLIVLFAPLTTPYALREANASNIPTIALCDSNVDPRHFTYPIPCNDDSLRVLELVSGVLAEAGKEGAKKRDVNRQQRQEMARRVGQAVIIEEGANPSAARRDRFARAG